MVLIDDTGEVHISLPKMPPFVFVMCPLVIELFVKDGMKFDTGIVPWRSGDLMDLAFMSSAASAFDIFSCFFHLVLRFWNQIFT